MPLRIRVQYATGRQLGYSIERLSDGNYFDNSDKLFKSSPVTPVASLPEDTGIFLGRYKTNIDASIFLDGDYAVSIHDLSANQVVSILSCLIHSGDDATTIPLSQAMADPWASSLPATYAPGTAGYIVGSYIDTAISSRSVFSGGAVSSVTTPVTVGTNNDKSGYGLNAQGIDAITIENGINLRQAISPILAASAGVLTGAGTGTIIIRGATASSTRITATTDNAGNRTAVTLSLPT